MMLLLLLLLLRIIVYTRWSRWRGIVVHNFPRFATANSSSSSRRSRRTMSHSSSLAFNPRSGRRRHTNNAEPVLANVRKEMFVVPASITTTVQERYQWSGLRSLSPGNVDVTKIEKRSPSGIEEEQGKPPGLTRPCHTQPGDNAALTK